MSFYLYLILAYLIVLSGLNIYRVRQVRTQEQFMVAGRSVKTWVMVFTLICTWIGSGTFIAGAELASKAGFSAIWLPAGAFLGIILIYFIAGKVRTFGQYTIGDILEERYGPLARIIGSLTIIISFTATISYQFVAGGFILNVATDGAVSEFRGMLLTAIFVLLFTASAGMLAVIYTDLPNGIVIVLACLLSLPFLYFGAGGWSGLESKLDARYFALINDQFGAHPTIKVIGYFLATFLLLMGVQSMYQKFYSARSAREAKKAVIFWVIGVIFVESVAVAIAVFAYSQLQGQIDLSIPKEGGKVIILAARQLVPPLIGVLLLGAVCAVVISTSMNYLLSSSTNIIRDLYQRFINKNASQKFIVALQRIFVLFIGVIAFFLAVRMTSVLETAVFAYTIYGVSITPALLAALTWKRATRAGGLASILSGAFVAILMRILVEVLPPEKVIEGDPFGIPILFFALPVSLLSLFGVSLLTKKPSPQELTKFFPDMKADGQS